MEAKEAAINADDLKQRLLNIRRVPRSDQEMQIIMNIERGRKSMLQDNRPLVQDGMERPGPFDQQTIAKAARGSKNYVNCLRLYECVISVRPIHAIELGTNLGVSTCYLSAAIDRQRFGEIHSFEVSPYRIKEAQSLVDRVGLVRPCFHRGFFKDTLPQHVESAGYIDFAFIDGDHTFDGTLFLAECISSKLSSRALVVFDDIYWSQEMSDVWHKIQKMECWSKSFEVEDMGYCMRQ
jgi:predicted O-methyltransferase YrrM